MAGLAGLRTSIEAVHRFLSAAPNDPSGSIERAQCSAVCSLITGAGGASALDFAGQASLMELVNGGPWVLDTSRAAITQALVTAASPVPGAGHGGPRSVQTMLHFHEYPTAEWMAEFNTRRGSARGVFFADTCCQCGISNPSEKTVQALVAYFLYLEKGYQAAVDMSMQDRLAAVENFKTQLRTCAGIRNHRPAPIATWREWPPTAEACLSNPVNI